MLSMFIVLSFEYYFTMIYKEMHALLLNIRHDCLGIFNVQSRYNRGERIRSFKWLFCTEWSLTAIRFQAVS